MQKLIGDWVMFKEFLCGATTNGGTLRTLLPFLQLFLAISTYIGLLLG